jgi:hypothetical protein
MQNMNITAVRTGAKRHAGDGQTNAAENRLDERGHADAERHGACRLAGQDDRTFAALAAQPIAETPHAGGRLLARGIEDGGEGDGEQELYENQPEAADFADEPACQVRGVGCHLGGKLGAAGRGGLLPCLFEPPADERHVGNPGGRRMYMQAAQ